MDLFFNMLDLMCWHMCIHACIHTCILDLGSFFVGSSYIHASWILDLFCWIFIHTCILDLGSFFLDLHTYMHLGSWIFCVGSSYIHASWILYLLCWIFIHTCILDLGSFVVDLHTYMHLGSWVFCVGSYLYSFIGSSNVPFVRSHFGLDRVAGPCSFLAILAWIESLAVQPFSRSWLLQKLSAGWSV